MGTSGSSDARSAVAVMERADGRLALRSSLISNQACWLRCSCFLQVSRRWPINRLSHNLISPILLLREVRREVIGESGVFLGHNYRNFDLADFNC